MIEKFHCLLLIFRVSISRANKFGVAQLIERLLRSSIPFYALLNELLFQPVALKNFFLIRMTAMNLQLPHFP